LLPFDVVKDAATGKRHLQLKPLITAESAKIISHCNILELPFDQLKTEIKSTYSERTFGGQGSAEAVGTKVLAVAIPPEAHLGTQGVYSAFASVTRKAFIKPKEPFVKPLSELPWQTIWGDSYPYPDEVSDDQLFRDLLIAREDPAKADDATAILRAAGSSSLMREMDRETIEGPMTIGPEYYAQEQKESLYQSYKLRHWDMIDVGLYIGPGHSLDADNNQAFGDYALTPNVTTIPVSYGSVVSAGRSNENGNARGKVKFNGVEVKLVNTVILEPTP